MTCSSPSHDRSDIGLLLGALRSGTGGYSNLSAREKGRREVENCFYGSMRWDAEAGEIEVRWRDGKVTRGAVPDDEEAEA